MSVILYDKAVTDKIRSWVPNEVAKVLAPDETRRLFSINADMTNDAPLELPLITLSRDRNITLDLTNKRLMCFEGKTFYSENGVSDHLNVIPITLSYTLNIYTRFAEEADEFTREFAFYIVNYPNLVVHIPNTTIPGNPKTGEPEHDLISISFLSLQPEIVDGSDIPERLIPDQFSRSVMSFRLNDAYYFSYNHREIPRVVATGIKTVKPPTVHKGRRSVVEESFTIPSKHKED